MNPTLITPLIEFTSNPVIRAAMLMFNCERKAELDGEPVRLRAVPAFVPVVDTGEVCEMPKKRESVDMFGEVIAVKRSRKTKAK